MSPGWPDRNHVYPWFISDDDESSAILDELGNVTSADRCVDIEHWGMTNIDIDRNTASERRLTATLR